MSFDSKFYVDEQIGRDAWTINFRGPGRVHPTTFNDPVGSKALLRNRFYYSLKPFLPFRARLAVRRWFARHKLERVSGSWPIMPGSEKTPARWRGWPDGKKFALVLT